MSALGWGGVQKRGGPGGGWAIEEERKKRKKGQTNHQNEYLTNAVSFGVQAGQHS